LRSGTAWSIASARGAAQRGGVLLLHGPKFSSATWRELHTPAPRTSWQRPVVAPNIGSPVHEARVSSRVSHDGIRNTSSTPLNNLCSRQDSYDASPIGTGLKLRLLRFQQGQGLYGTQRSAPPVEPRDQLTNNSISYPQLHIIIAFGAPKKA